jgi:hypothetical protein
VRERRGWREERTGENRRGRGIRRGRREDEGRVRQWRWGVGGRRRADRRRKKEGGGGEAERRREEHTFYKVIAFGGLLV